MPRILAVAGVPRPAVVPLHAHAEPVMAPLCERCGARKEYRVPLERVGHGYMRAWICSFDWRHSYWKDAA